MVQMKKLYFALILCITTLLSCEMDTSSLIKMEFGKVGNQTADLYTLGFEGGLKASFTNYGLIVTSLSVPDRNGKVGDIVLGYDDLGSYLEETPYFGSIIGRYGNRIDSGRFFIDSVAYTLAQNNGPNHLHGGTKGFDKVVWDIVDYYKKNDSIGFTFKYVSPDGEEGYPGTLTTIVDYVFYPDSWKISYRATTDKPTVVNLTQHTYFNLSADPASTILDHELMLEASRYLPVDSTLIPTGELRPVSNTPFDFTSSKAIGQDINADNQQIKYGGGYDHCWVFDKGISKIPEKVGSLYHPETGRLVEVFTTEPAVQFYTGNFLDGSLTGKDGIKYEYRSAVCLETQHYPDSPNQPDFPSVVLRPGQTYQTVTEYKFGLK